MTRAVCIIVVYRLFCGVCKNDLVRVKIVSAFVNGRVNRALW